MSESTQRGSVAGSSLFLIGYRGSGKTSVGRLLAERLGVAFVDTDRDIESRAGTSIAEIFRVHGEERFREIESEAVHGVVERCEQGERLVAATGGGVILRPRNVQEMRGVGRVVWLQASVEELRRRIAGDPGSLSDRPALAGASAIEEIGALLEARAPFYSAAADLEIETDGFDVDEIAARVVDSI